MTYAERWTDFPDFIIGITQEIWEGRKVESLKHYYAPDIPVRSPMGITRGNKAVIDATWATLAEFPDRELLAEDVIWSNDPVHGYLSSHRIISTATHTNDGLFGRATGKRITVRVIADCAAKGGTIFDEWLVRDYGGIVRQLGQSPRDYAANLIATEGGASLANPVFTPELDVDGGYHGRGNNNSWGAKYADILTAIWGGHEHPFLEQYDRAAIGEFPGARTEVGAKKIRDFWLQLRSAFPAAVFRVHHQIGLDGDRMSPRAAIRWSLDGKHDGPGAFGEPTGANVHIMGMSHAEFGPWGLRREFVLYDEIAVWKQILMSEA